MPDAGAGAAAATAADPFWCLWCRKTNAHQQTSIQTNKHTYTKKLTSEEAMPEAAAGAAAATAADGFPVLVVVALEAPFGAAGLAAAAAAAAAAFSSSS